MKHKMSNQPGQQQPPQPGQGQNLTPTELASAVAMALRQSMPQQQPQQRQMTQEEIDARLGTFVPDMGIVEALFGANATPEGRLQALTYIVQSTVANATGHARYLSEDYLKKYHAHIAEQLEDAKYAANERFYDGIYQGHEGLKPFDGLLRQMLPTYEQAPDYPTDRSERAKYVREKFVPHVKTIDPNFDPTRPPVQAAQQGHLGRPYANSPQNNSGQQTQQRPQGAGLPSLGGGGSGATTGASHVPTGRPAWDTTGHGF